MRILVTGGMGFLGSHLVDALIKDGHSVVVFDNLDEQVHQGKKPDYLNKNAKYIIGDVRNRKALAKALIGCEVIFHEAASVGVGQSMYKIAHYIDNNDLGTANLLDILVNEKNKVKKLVVASSMSIYGEGEYNCKKCGDIVPKLRGEKQLKEGDWEMHCPICNQVAKPIATKESKMLESTSVYAFSKRHQEELCLLIGRTYNLPTVALRYFNIYGPRQALSNPYTGVCAIFSARIKNNHAPIVYEDGLQTRDFISVFDIVAANIMVMKDSRADYRAFNVGTGRPIAILDIAKTIARLSAKTIDPEVVRKYRKGDIRHCFADISEIEKIGFRPKVSFDAGMKELVRWSEGINAKDRSELANKELLKKGLVEK